MILNTQAFPQGGLGLPQASPSHCAATPGGKQWRDTHGLLLIFPNPARQTILCVGKCIHTLTCGSVVL